MVTDIIEIASIGLRGTSLLERPIDYPFEIVVVQQIDCCTSERNLISQQIVVEIEESRVALAIHNVAGIAGMVKGIRSFPLVSIRDNSCIYPIVEAIALSELPVTSVTADLFNIVIPIVGQLEVLTAGMDYLYDSGFPIIVEVSACTIGIGYLIQFGAGIGKCNNTAGGVGYPIQ